MPSAEFDSEGRLVYRSDRHQKKVLKEMGTAADRERERMRVLVQKQPK